MALIQSTPYLLHGEELLPVPNATCGLVYHPPSGKTICVFLDANSGYIFAVVIDGSGISTPVSTGVNPAYISQLWVKYSAETGKVVVVGQSFTAGATIFVIEITVGSSLSFSYKGLTVAGMFEGKGAVTLAPGNKAIITGYGSYPNPLKAIAVQINASSLTVGAIVTVDSRGCNTDYPPSLLYASNGKIYYLYSLSVAPYYSKLVIGTLSNLVLGVSAAQDFDANNSVSWATLVEDGGTLHCYYRNGDHFPKYMFGAFGAPMSFSAPVTISNLGAGIELFVIKDTKLQVVAEEWNYPLLGNVQIYGEGSVTSFAEQAVFLPGDVTLGVRGFAYDQTNARAIVMYGDPLNYAPLYVTTFAIQPAYEHFWTNNTLQVERE